jgi:ABC-type multidrug transport system permease subunit
MSGIFFPRGSIPKWMLHVADFFPIKHLVDAMLTVFDPRHVGSRFAGNDLLFLAAWGVGSIAIAARYFRWTPTNR